MSSPISRIQMPEIPMKHILECLDFPSILVLRKVCHDLRNFIDDTKPTSRLMEIEVYMTPEYIEFELDFSQPSTLVCFTVSYANSGKGCLVKCDKDGNVTETVLENEDFVTVSCNDFNIILRHQKTLLEEFYIEFNFSNSTTKERVLEHVNKSLKSLNHHPLQVKSLSMIVSNHDYILSILPYIDPKQLKKIYINEPSKRGNVVLNLDKIGRLEQWKQVKDLSIHGFRLPYPIQNFKHFSYISFHSREILTDIEVLIPLKELFLSSSTLSSMLIYNYEHLSKDVMRQRPIDSFGQPFVSNQARNWFFKIPDTNQFLRMRNYKFKYSICFDRIEKSDVPQNALIQN